MAAIGGSTALRRQAAVGVGGVSPIVAAATPSPLRHHHHGVRVIALASSGAMRPWRVQQQQQQQQQQQLSLALSSSSSSVRCHCASTASTSSTTAPAPSWRRQQQQQQQQREQQPHQWRAPASQPRRRGVVPAAGAAALSGGADTPDEGVGGDGGGSENLAAKQQQQQQQDDQQPPPSSAPPLPAVASRLPRFQPWSLGAPLAWGLMLGYVLVMLVLPIAALLGKASLVPAAVFWARATEPVALSAYFVSFSMAVVAALVNGFFGFILAWVLVKYDFPCKKWIDAAVDLPFALPTSVAGLTLATVYSEEGVLGALLTRLGVNVVFTRLGVAVAMVFVSFPFVVRTMQPVLQEMEKEVEEASWSLGASPWDTFTKVLLPPLLPPLLTGVALAFSRAIGEFGSIVIVSSNFPFKDLIAPVLIFQALEQYDYVGATVIGTVLLLISMVMMVGVNYLQSLGTRLRGGK